MRKASVAKLIASLLFLGLASTILSGCVKKINLEIVNHTSQQIRVDWLTAKNNGSQYVVGNVASNNIVKFDSGLPSGGDYHLLFYNIKTGGLLKRLDADGGTVDSHLENNTWTVTIKRNKEIQW